MHFFVILGLVFTTAGALNTNTFSNMVQQLLSVLEKKSEDNYQWPFAAGRTEYVEPACQIIDNKLSIIYFHGSGESAARTREKHLMHHDRLPYATIIIPQAIRRAVSSLVLKSFGKYETWFDLRNCKDAGCENETDIVRARDAAHELMSQAIANMGDFSSHLAVWGFSIGAALAPYCSHTYNRKLLRVVANSGFAVRKDEYTDTYEMRISYNFQAEQYAKEVLAAIGDVDDLEGDNEDTFNIRH